MGTRHFRLLHLSAVWLVALAIGTGCADEKRKKRVGDSCSDDIDCESGICYENLCLDPDGDLDGDGLKNGVEKNLSRTNPGLADSDGDGVPDGLEVGSDPTRPLDRDGDGQIDALESRLPQADVDGDCIPDEYDPRNDQFDEDNAVLVELGCLSEGVCGAGAASIVARCVEGKIQCDYTAVPGWEAQETSCDGRDNDCDGETDQGNLLDPTPDACSTEGVCGEGSAPRRECRNGAFVCLFDAIPGWEASETLCDARDNDCDGQTDEGLRDQDCQVENEFGKCPGTTRCAETGGAVVCEGPVPAPETCNGQDDDCDGQTDEDLVDQQCVVTNEFGSCPGTTVCDEQGGTVCNAPSPLPEACNGEDDNCDGQIDEGNICGRTVRVTGIVLRPAATLPAISLPPSLAARAEGVPLSGATVRVGVGAACDGQIPPGPFYQMITGPDGRFDLLVEPGQVCVLMDAPSFLALRSELLPLEEGDVLTLQVLLHPQGTSVSDGTLCGRVQALGNGNLPDPVPLAGVLVQAFDAQELSLGETVTSERGLFCLGGLPVSVQESPALRLLFLKEGWFRSEAYPLVEENGLTFLQVLMKPLPPEPSVCFADDFEMVSGPGEGGATQSEWTIEPVDHEVSWYQVAWSPTNSAAGECVWTPEEEVCQTQSPCVLCGGTRTPGCIPQPNALPTAYSGNSAYWFGNLELGNYLPFQQSCGEVGKTVSGTLTSPWISIGEAVGLVLEFATAWEVESRDLAMDRMFVEAQSAQMPENQWLPILDLKKGANNAGAVSPGQGLSSGGLGRSPAWVVHQVPLDQFQGTGSLRFRFRFDSVDGADNAFRGWMIDRVIVQGRGCGDFFVR